MGRLNRLLRYFKPYWLYLLASVISMALVGLLDAFRLLLIGPVLDKVLNPASQGRNLPLLPIPIMGRHIELQSFVPEYFHNVWTIVAFALVASTLLKGVLDFGGTYLANYAGFGMVTDLRNELYAATLRRSIGFFQKHSTGSLLSAIVNDVERVQFAMSSVLAEFLQQFFTFLFTAIVVVGLGRRLTWVLIIFVPFIVLSARRVGDRVRTTTRKGQDKLAEIHTLLHETITGIRIVKAFCMEAWEMRRFREAARRLFKANLRTTSAFAMNSPMMDIFGAIAIALLILLGREYIKHGYLSEGFFIAFIIAVFKLYE
ncbi:MAG: ABC transporter transmembrane domain-containing protein, partial [Candidatus Korobacteraceae bacterium]